MRNFVILGAGIAGMTAALELRKKYGAEVRIQILEKNPEPGGLLLGSDLGGYNADNGCFFYTSDERLPKRYPGLFEKADVSWRIRLRGETIPYPPGYKSILKQRSPAYKAKAIGEMLWGRSAGSLRKPRTARECLYQTLGREITKQSNLEVYLEKLQGIQADRIHPYLCDKRLASLKQPLWKLLNKQFTGGSRRSGAVWQRIVTCYPKGGGRNLVRRVQQECLANGTEIHCDRKLGRILPVGSVFLCSAGKDEFSADRLISTIPLSSLAEALPADEKIQRFPRPEHTTMQVVLFLAARTIQETDHHVLYSFEKKHLWKRTTCHRVDEQRYTVAVEINLNHDCQETQKQELLRRIRTDLTEEIKLFQADDIIEEKIMTVPNAYPVFGADTWERILQLRDYIEKRHGICLLGRQGQHEYLSSNQAVERVIGRIGS